MPVLDEKELCQMTIMKKDRYSKYPSPLKKAICSHFSFLFRSIPFGVHEWNLVKKILGGNFQQILEFCSIDVSGKFAKLF